MTGLKPNKCILGGRGENQPKHNITQTIYNLHDKSMMTTYISSHDAPTWNPGLVVSCANKIVSDPLACSVVRNNNLFRAACIWYIQLNLRPWTYIQEGLLRKGLLRLQLGGFLVLLLLLLFGARGVECSLSTVNSIIISPLHALRTYNFKPRAPFWITF